MSVHPSGYENQIQRVFFSKTKPIKILIILFYLFFALLHKFLTNPWSSVTSSSALCFQNVIPATHSFFDCLLTNSCAANHKAATQCGPPEVHSQHQDGEEWMNEVTLKVVNMVVAGLRASQTAADLLGFCAISQPYLKTEEKKKKSSESGVKGQEGQTGWKL